MPLLPVILPRLATEQLLVTATEQLQNTTR
jgi:hypothetical protein